MIENAESSARILPFLLNSTFPGQHVFLVLMRMTGEGRTNLLGIDQIDQTTKLCSFPARAPGEEHARPALLLLCPHPGELFG